MSMPRELKKPARLCTMPGWSRQTTSTEYVTTSRRAARGSVRRTLIVMPPASPSFLSSVSSLASVCQLPDTSNSIANSLPSAVMRLSTMLPLQSSTMRVRS